MIDATAWKTKPIVIVISEGGDSDLVYWTPRAPKAVGLVMIAVQPATANVPPQSKSTVVVKYCLELPGVGKCWVGGGGEAVEGGWRCRG